MEDEGVRTSGSEAFSRSLAVIAGHLQALGDTLQTYKTQRPCQV
jgi:hypothetical protein